MAVFLGLRFAFLFGISLSGFGGVFNPPRNAASNRFLASALLNLSLFSRVDMEENPMGERRPGWLFSADDKHTKDISRAVYELRDQSDRSAAIVASSILDLVLTSALKDFLYQAPKVTKEFFAITGPVGDFGPKIDLALLVSLIDESIHRDLITVREIRNYFAHKLTVSSFLSDAVATLSHNIKIVDKRSHDNSEKVTGKTMRNFSIGIDNRKEILADPRERFLLAVQILVWDLSMPKKVGQSKPIRF